MRRSLSSREGSLSFNSRSHTPWWRQEEEEANQGQKDQPRSTLPLLPGVYQTHLELVNDEKWSP